MQISLSVKLCKYAVQLTTFFYSLQMIQAIQVLRFHLLELEKVKKYLFWKQFECYYSSLIVHLRSNPDVLFLSSNKKTDIVLNDIAAQITAT